MIAVGGEACKEDSLCPVPLPAGRESGTVCEVNTERAAQRWAEQSDVAHFSFSKGKCATKVKECEDMSQVSDVCIGAAFKTSGDKNNSI